MKKKAKIDFKSHFEMPEETSHVTKNPKEPYKVKLFSSSEKNKNWVHNSKMKIQLESEIMGLDEEIEQLTHQINQYL